MQSEKKAISVLARHKKHCERLRRKGAGDEGANRMAEAKERVQVMEGQTEMQKLSKQKVLIRSLISRTLLI